VGVQREIGETGPLLDGRGRLRESGFSWEPRLGYERSAVRAAPWRLKEWDFYQILDRDICMQFTIGHASYMGQASFTLFELSGGARNSLSIMRLLPFGSMGLPSSPDIGLSCESGPSRISFKVERGKRLLSCNMRDPRKGIEIEASVELEEEGRGGITIATPFAESPRDFYYNTKLCGMRAQGYASIRGSGSRESERRYELGEGASGLLDWGRGVWPYRHEWYWGSASGRAHLADAEAKDFGLNIGCGFGDTSQASENAFFYDGRACKLGEVRIERDGDDYLAPWRFSSDDGRLELTLSPRFDNHTSTKLLFVDNDCHQVFGRFDGRAILDDGRELLIEGLNGFCEHARNRW
jgi:hypothetical protein